MRSWWARAMCLAPWRTGNPTSTACRRSASGLKSIPTVKVGSFEEAARHGEVVMNATNGMGSLAALELAGEANLAGKILIDISNPLDFSRGMPPTLSVCNTDSLGEQIQRADPRAKVVKTLNTVTAAPDGQPAPVGRRESSHLRLRG